jgi:hypothetical protein
LFVNVAPGQDVYKVASGGDSRRQVALGDEDTVSGGLVGTGVAREHGPGRSGGSSDTSIGRFGDRCN